MTEELLAQTFEEALKELENIVRQCEAGGLTLQKALEAYERGMALQKHCSDLLNQAKVRIETIKKGYEEEAV